MKFIGLLAIIILVSVSIGLLGYFLNIFPAFRFSSETTSSAPVPNPDQPKPLPKDNDPPKPLPKDNDPPKPPKDKELPIIPLNPKPTVSPSKPTTIRPSLKPTIRPSLKPTVPKPTQPPPPSGKCRASCKFDTFRDQTTCIGDNMAGFRALNAFRKEQNVPEVTYNTAAQNYTQQCADYDQKNGAHASFKGGVQVTNGGKPRSQCEAWGGTTGDSITGFCFFYNEGPGGGHYDICRDAKLTQVCIASSTDGKYWTWNFY